MNEEKLKLGQLRNGDWYIEIGPDGERIQKEYNNGMLKDWSLPNAYAMEFPWSDHKLMKAWGFIPEDNNGMNTYVRKDCRIWRPLFDGGRYVLSILKEFPGTGNQYEEQKFFFKYMHEFQQLMDIAGLTIQQNKDND